MTYLQTEYFLHVAENKSITKTASELYVSPPAISKQIMLLEEELGVTLFARGAKGMELTPAGEIMYNHFSNQKTAFEHAYTKAKSIGSARSNVLHLGVLAKWHLWNEFHQIRKYLKDSPSHADIELHSCFNPGGDSKLEKGELDAVICLSNDILIYAQAHDLQFREIARVPKVFLYSQDSPMAKKPGLSPSDFKDVPLLVLSSKVAIDAHQNNMNLCHRLGLTPNVIFKDTLEDVLMSVGMNEGFFICDSWLNPLNLPEMRHIIVPDTHSVVIAWWRHNNNPGLASLIDCCTNMIEWPYSI